MKTRTITLIFILATLIAGCSSTTYIPKVFAADLYSYDVAQDAIPVMKKMEDLQKWANDGKEPSERNVMSLYAKADRNDNGKITRKEAEKTLKEYKAQMEAVLGAIPFQFPEE